MLRLRPVERGGQTWILATTIPRCTGRAPEWSPKRETPVLASRALATGPFLRFFQARPARKLRLTDPRPRVLLRRDPNFADAPETAQNGGFRHHFATECVLWISLCQPVGLDLKHRLRANIGCETWLVPSIAFCPKGTFLVLKRAHMGTAAYVLAR